MDPGLAGTEAQLGHCCSQVGTGSGAAAPAAALFPAQRLWLLLHVSTALGTDAAANGSLFV